jgi:hypothetical protein
METDNQEAKMTSSAQSSVRDYQLRPFQKAAHSVGMMNPGPERSGAPAPPAPALIHQKSNSGIDLPATELKPDEKTRLAVAGMIEQMPGRLRKKMFALRSRIEWLVHEYGVEHVGLQTLTIRENITDRKEFNKRFKSLSTNVFPKIYGDWIRVFERQQRGAWHAHVVVATKQDIRTECDVAALNQLLKDNKDRKITKAIYYAGIHRLASPNLRAIWKEFRRLCGIREFKERRKAKGKRYYKFDACHLMPIISSPQAMAMYVSKYISKGFENRRPEDKGVRLVGCSKRVSQVCSERFSWVDGAGSLWRTKLGILAGMLHFACSDDFARKLGPKWAYHLRPAIDLLVLPYYASMKLARADGWDLVSTSDGSPWPWSDLDLPKAEVQQSRIQAFNLARQLIERRNGKPRRKSRAETGWAPERWECKPRRPRVYKYFKPPAKERVLCQGELLTFDVPQFVKD